MKPPKKEPGPAEEMTRRGAAGLARSTAGRSRVLNPDKKKYDRKREKQADGQE